MKKIIYFLLFLLPVLLEAQNRANVQDRLLLPKTPPKPTTPLLLSPISYRIYPNPAQDNINLDIGIEKNGEATLNIYNAQGGLQASRSYKVTEGSQSFPFQIRNPQSKAN